jgi:hypothetical protein
MLKRSRGLILRDHLPHDLFNEVAESVGLFAHIPSSRWQDHEPLSSSLCRVYNIQVGLTCQKAI